MNDNNIESTIDKNFELPEPNPKTARQHREEFRRQILIPLLMGVLLIIGLVVALWVMEIGSPERWASISTIILFMPLLLIGLLVLGLLVFFMLMLGELMRVLPPYTRLAQNAVDKIKEQVEAGADISVQPIVRLRSYLALIERLFGLSKKS